MKSPLPIVVSTRGTVGERHVRRAREKLTHSLRAAPRSVLYAHLSLLHEPDPAVERPSLAKACVEIDGHIVRAHASAPHMEEAIDELEERLRRRLEERFDREQERRHDTGVGPPGEWRHGNLPTRRPPYYPRRPDERRLLRRKTFSVAQVTFEEAASEMELLDHDFYLFVDADSGEDAVVYREPDGGLGRLERAATATTTLQEAIERLNVTDEPFVFFVDRASGRGCVVYRRYDGHYGLIEQAG